MQNNSSMKINFVSWFQCLLYSVKGNPFLAIRGFQRLASKILNKYSVLNKNVGEKLGIALVLQY